MKGHLADAALAAALLVAQTAGGGGAGPPGVHPDLLLLFVLAAGMRRGGEAGALWGIALGFAQDTFSAGLPGTAVLTKGLLGFAAGRLRGQLDCDNPNTQAIVAVTATFVDGLAHLALLEVFSAGRGLLLPLLGVVAPAAVVHGALLPAGIAAGRGAARRLRRRVPARAV